MRELKFVEMQGRGRGLMVSGFRNKSERTSIKTFIRLMYGSWEAQKILIKEGKIRPKKNAKQIIQNT